MALAWRVCTAKAIERRQEERKDKDGRWAKRPAREERAGRSRRDEEKTKEDDKRAQKREKE